MGTREPGSGITSNNNNNSNNNGSGGGGGAAAIIASMMGEITDLTKTMKMVKINRQKLGIYSTHWELKMSH